MMFHHDKFPSLFFVCTELRTDVMLNKQQDLQPMRFHRRRGLPSMMHNQKKKSLVTPGNNKTLNMEEAGIIGLSCNTSLKHTVLTRGIQTRRH